MKKLNLIAVIVISICLISSIGYSDTSNGLWGLVQDPATRNAGLIDTQHLNQLMGLDKDTTQRAVRYYEFDDFINNRFDVLERRFNNLDITPTQTVTGGTTDVVINREDLISADTTIYVGPTRTLKTLYEAHSYLRTKRIESEVTVTVQVDNGSYTFNDPFIMRHPQGSQIRWYGDRSGAMPPNVVITVDREGLESRGSAFVCENEHALILDGFHIVGDGFCNFTDYALEFMGNGVRAAWGGVVAVGPHMYVEGFCHNYAALHAGVMMANGTYNSSTGRYENGPKSYNPTYYGFLSGLGGYMQAAGAYSNGGYDNFHASSAGMLHAQDSTGEYATYNNYLAGNQGFVGANRATGRYAGGGSFTADTNGYLWCGTDNTEVAHSIAAGSYYGALAIRGGILISEGLVVTDCTVPFSPPQNVMGPNAAYNSGQLTNGTDTFGAIIGMDGSLSSSGDLKNLTFRPYWDSSNSRIVLEAAASDSGGTLQYYTFPLTASGATTGNVWPDSAVDIQGSSTGLNGITATANDFHIQSGTNDVIIDSALIKALVGYDSNSGVAVNRLTGLSGVVGSGHLQLEALITSNTEGLRGFYPKLKLHEVPYASPQTDPYGVTLRSKLIISDNINSTCATGYRLELDGYEKATGADFSESITTGYGTDGAPQGLAATHITSRSATYDDLTLGVNHDGGFDWQVKLINATTPHTNIKKLFVGDLTSDPGATFQTTGSTILGMVAAADSSILNNSANLRPNSISGDLEIRYRNNSGTLSTVTLGAGASNLWPDGAVNITGSSLGTNGITAEANDFHIQSGTHNLYIDSAYIGALVGKDGNAGIAVNKIYGRLASNAPTGGTADSPTLTLGVPSSYPSTFENQMRFLPNRQVNIASKVHIYPESEASLGTTGGWPLMVESSSGGNSAYFVGNVSFSSSGAVNVLGNLGAWGTTYLQNGYFNTLVQNSGTNYGVATNRVTGRHYTDPTLDLSVPVSSSTITPLMRLRASPLQVNATKVFVGDLSSTADTTFETTGTTFLGCVQPNANSLSAGQMTMWAHTDGNLYLYAKDSTGTLRTYRLTPFGG